MLLQYEKYLKGDTSPMPAPPAYKKRKSSGGGASASDETRSTGSPPADDDVTAASVSKKVRVPRRLRFLIMCCWLI